MAAEWNCGEKSEIQRSQSNRTIDQPHWKITQKGAHPSNAAELPDPPDSRLNQKDEHPERRPAHPIGIQASQTWQELEAYHEQHQCPDVCQDDLPRWVRWARTVGGVVQRRLYGCRPNYLVDCWGSRIAFREVAA